jgi:NDP-sugar pyrophosphorylase family protein
LCFRRDVFKNVPVSEPVGLEQKIYADLIAEGQVRAFVTRQRFFDIGTPERLQEFVAKTT